MKSVDKEFQDKMISQIFQETSKLGSSGLRFDIINGQEEVIEPNDFVLNPPEMFSPTML